MEVATSTGTLDIEEVRQVVARLKEVEKGSRPGAGLCGTDASYAGVSVGGEGFTTFTIAGPTGEGLTSARTFTRKRRCVLVDAFSIR